MSSRSLSPGGALLRRSKVFSIPTPLPRGVETRINSQVASKTATTPHPYHLSITTPLSSLKEGDWGLKRPLPLRTTTQASSPSVRIEAIDTVEKVTSFKSSGDHAITLQKWQELDLPITFHKKYPNHVNPARLSVFEESVDTLEKRLDNNNLEPNDDHRWKFKGPWLGGLCEGEFTQYVKTQVQARKKEFQQYLRNECARAKTSDARNIFISEGSEGKLPKYEASDITDEELVSFIKTHRQTRVQLYRMIRSFLDLPPAIFADLNDLNIDLENFFHKKQEETKPIDKTHGSLRTSPPKTHPSAGLSYHRTSNHIYNHPEFGPQAKNPPVRARVVLPKNVANSVSRTALVGIAGFVSGIPDILDSNFNMKGKFKNSKDFAYSKFPGLQNLDSAEETGSKSWVHPTQAELDCEGRVHIEWDLGDPEAVAIRTGTVDEIIQKPVPISETTVYWGHSTKKSGSPLISNAGQYGLDSMLQSKTKEPSDNETYDELRSLIDDSIGVR